jgi:segregation and condensation protein B
MMIGDEREARAAIEAVIMAAIEPVPPAVLAQLVELPTARVEEICDELVAEYEREGRGFTIGRVAGGYRYQTHFDSYAYVERFVLDGQTARLSGPALETLAIIGYKQPISRAQVSAIRGVNVDATLKTLVARGYVEEVGHEPTPGNPVLFGTTTAFLERLGIDSLEELPALGDFVPDASIVEALERGLRVPTADEVAPDMTDGVDDADDTEPERGSGADGDAVAAELQSGLDDD